MFDLGAIMRIKNDFTVLMGNHPKLSTFFADLGNKGYCEGQEIAIAIRYPDGTEIKTGIRLQQSDINVFNDLKALSAQQGGNNENY